MRTEITPKSRVLRHEPSTEALKNERILNTQSSAEKFAQIMSGASKPKANLSPLGQYAGRESSQDMVAQISKATKKYSFDDF